MWEYIIIDVAKMRNVTEIEFRTEFDEDFFVNNFDERKEDDENAFSCFYMIDEYQGDVCELVNFYIENKDVLCLPGRLNYRLQLGNAWTYFYIDFVNAKAQMGFQTPDQFLYECLLLEYDLTPFGLQDAKRKMGIEKMQEIFEKLKEIRIPNESIPTDLYQQYLIQCNTGINKRMVKGCR